MKIFYPYNSGVVPPPSGDVSGPASSVDNAIPLFSGTTGKLLKMSNTLFGNDSAIEFDSASPATFDPAKYTAGVYDDGAIFPFAYNAPTGSAHRFYVAGSQIINISDKAVRVTTGSTVGSTAASLSWEVSSNTALPGEFSNIDFKLDPVGGQNFAAGAISLQREFRVRAPTYTGDGVGTTFTIAATHCIDGPVSAGNLAAIDVSVGSLINTRNVTVGTSGSIFGSLVLASGVVNGQGTTGVIGCYGALSTGSVNLGNTTDTTSVACSYYASAIQYSAVLNTRTISKLATYYAVGAPTISGTVAVTEGPYALWMDSGASRFDGRVLYKQGTGIVSANDLTIGEDGFYFIVTNNINIQRIATAGFTSGSFITLGFTGTLTMEHGIASGGGFASIECPSGFDIACVNGTELLLRYSSSRDSWAVISILQP